MNMDNANCSLYKDYLDSMKLLDIMGELVLKDLN